MEEVKKPRRKYRILKKADYEHIKISTMNQIRKIVEELNLTKYFDDVVAKLTYTSCKCERHKKRPKQPGDLHLCGI